MSPRESHIQSRRIAKLQKSVGMLRSVVEKQQNEIENLKASKAKSAIGIGDLPGKAQRSNTLVKSTLKKERRRNQSYQSYKKGNKNVTVPVMRNLGWSSASLCASLMNESIWPRSKLAKLISSLREDIIMKNDMCELHILDTF